MTLTVDEIVDRICNEVNVTRDEVMRKIKEKKEELSGLISDQGAAIIVAKEYGINIYSSADHPLKIGDIDLDLSEVDFVGRIVRIFEPRSFTRKDGSEGKLQNLVVADDTGSIRVTLWNRTVDSMASRGMKVGDPVKIISGVVKKGINGDPEISIERKSRFILNPEGVDVPEVDMSSLNIKTPERKYVSELVPDTLAEIRGTPVRLFLNRDKLIYEICPHCRKRLTYDRGWMCSEHGAVDPDYNMMLTLMVDDGTGVVRCVFFGGSAESLAGYTAKKVAEITGENPEKNIELADEIRKNIIGKELVISGRVRKNELFDRIEIIVTGHRDADPKEEAERLLEELGENI